MSIPTPPLPHAVLWDLDGTLIDSEPLWMAAEAGLMAEFGIEWTHDDAMRLVGNALPVSAEIMRSHGVPLENRQVIDRLIGEVMDGLRHEVPWRPGARELLISLQQAGVPQALVTMSEAVMADAVVQGLGFDPFDVKITGDVVHHGKPHPEPYLTAVARLEEKHGPMDARRIVAVEDSRPGTASAIAAGLVTVAVPLHVPLEPRPELNLLKDLDGVTPQDLSLIVVQDSARRASEPDRTSESDSY